MLNQLFIIIAFTLCLMGLWGIIMAFRRKAPKDALFILLALVLVLLVLYFGFNALQGLMQ